MKSGHFKPMIRGHFIPVLTPQLVELEMAEDELLENMGVQLLGVHPCPGKPGPQRPFPDPGHPFECRHVHPFSHPGWCQSNLL
jgi:hypothetical protein